MVRTMPETINITIIFMEPSRRCIIWIRIIKRRADIDSHMMIVGNTVTQTIIHISGGGVPHPDNIPGLNPIILIQNRIDDSSGIRSRVGTVPDIIISDKGHPSAESWDFCPACFRQGMPYETGTVHACLSLCVACAIGALAVAVGITVICRHSRIFDPARVIGRTQIVIR